MIFAVADMDSQVPKCQKWFKIFHMKLVKHKSELAAELQYLKQLQIEGRQEEVDKRQTIIQDLVEQISKIEKEQQRLISQGR